MPGYVRKRFGAIQALIRADCAPGWLDHQWLDFWGRLLALDTGPEVLKAGTYKTVLRAELPGAAVIVKRYRSRGLLRAIRSLLRPSRGRREFQAARAISTAGLPTAAPLCLAEQRRCGLVRASLVVLEMLDNARELQELFLAPGLCTGAARREVADRFGRLSSRIFRQGIFQSDYALNNFLVRPARAGYSLFFIDFEKVQVGPALDEATKWRLLAKLNRVGREVSRSNRLRFLRAYAAQEQGSAAGLKDWARRLQSETLAMLKGDLRRQRLTSIYTNRAYERINQAGWTGLCRKGYELEENIPRIARLPAAAGGSRLSLRFQGAEQHGLIALGFPGAEAERLWALISALKVAGAALELPEMLVQGRDRGFLVLDRHALPDERGLALHALLRRAFPDARSSLQALLGRVYDVARQSGAPAAEPSSSPFITD